jgi:hypothetical protein
MTNQIAKIIENLKLKVFAPLEWSITSEESTEPSRTVKLAVDTGRKIVNIWITYQPTLLGTVPREIKGGDIAVLGTKYISKPMLEQFKTQGVSVIDEAGNYFFFLSAR